MKRASQKLFKREGKKEGLSLIVGSNSRPVGTRQKEHEIFYKDVVNDYPDMSPLEDDSSASMARIFRARGGYTRGTSHY